MSTFKQRKYLVIVTRHDCGGPKMGAIGGMMPRLRLQRSLVVLPDGALNSTFHSCSTYSGFQTW